MVWASEVFFKREPWLEIQAPITGPKLFQMSSRVPKPQIEHAKADAFEQL